MVVINNNEKESKTLKASRYSEFLQNFRGGKEIISHQVIQNLSNITIPPKSSIIVELTK
jgi:hypothetical protein